MLPASAFMRRLWGELPVYLYAALCGAIMLMLWHATGMSYDDGQTLTSFGIFEVCVLLMFGIDLIWALARQRPKAPLDFLRRRYLSRDAIMRIAIALPALSLCIVMIPIFSSLKAMIPLFTSYDWDPVFIAWDRAIFLGNDAWVVLQPLFGYPMVTAAFAALYHLWALLLYPGCIFMAAYPVVSDDLRRRFFLTYALAWSVVGGAMAIGMASVGPAFAAPLVGIDTFKPQIAYLHSANLQVPVMTVAVQDMLLDRFLAGDGSLGSGVSAMPSMHIAIATLFWLAMREIGPRAGRSFLGFLIVIWIGSVHLAYHYAVDGLISVIAIVALWKISAWLFTWWDRIPTPAFQPALRTKTVPAE